MKKAPLPDLQTGDDAQLDRSGISCCRHSLAWGSLLPLCSHRDGSLATGNLKYHFSVSGLLSPTVCLCSEVSSLHQRLNTGYLSTLLMK